MTLLGGGRVAYWSLLSLLGNKESLSERMEADVESHLTGDCPGTLTQMMGFSSERSALSSPWPAIYYKIYWKFFMVMNEAGQSLKF